MLTAAHAHGDEGIQRAILGGVKTIEHGTYMSEESMDLMKKYDAYLVPTLTAGKEVEKIIGHYSNFSNALNRVAKEKFYQNENSYNTIQDYIETWNTVKEGIETMLNKVKL